MGRCVKQWFACREAPLCSTKARQQRSRSGHNREVRTWKCVEPGGTRRHPGFWLVFGLNFRPEVRLRRLERIPQPEPLALRVLFHEGGKADIIYQLPATIADVLVPTWIMGRSNETHLRSSIGPWRGFDRFGFLLLRLSTKHYNHPVEVSQVFRTQKPGVEEAGGPNLCLTS